ncbi:DMT family transporter [Clostridiales bacterium F-3ap]|uniref:DMT family transporter n=1 Tax=Anaerotalea alkaliphila TaxID=2662126 RepID=A0A7X5KMU5_9FIRM|nr:DMT family transporter [Anaerotalea alkaliphila]
MLVAVLWGFGFVAVKIGLNNGVGTYYLLSLRFLVATLVLLPFERSSLSAIPPRTLRGGVFLGVLLFLAFLFQTSGLARTTTANNAFLTSVNVILVPFLAWASTGRKVPLKGFLSAFLTLAGIGLLTLERDFSINSGDLLTLVCAVMFAGHIVGTSRYAKEAAIRTLVFLQMATALVLSVAMALLGGEIQPLEPSSLAAILYLGFFSTLAAFFLQTLGQKHAHPSKAAVLLSTESLFGALFAILVFRDPLTVRVFWGGLLVFAGVLLAESPGLSRRPASSKPTREAA